MYSYAWGGTSPKRGFDCSGFTLVVYQRNGFELPRSAAAQFRIGEPVPRDSLRKGDLLFFATGRRDRISHVGIYSGNNTFIHASTHDACIRTSNLSKSYYKKRYKGARRLIRIGNM
ncbi:MAG: C40 family peptidase [Proteobacteria bacterium]|nr:C40 family peptidase [Pseudomonadota bacterium]